MEIRVLAGVSVSVIGSPSALVSHLHSGEGLLWSPPQPLSLPWIRWAPSRSLASGRLAKIAKENLGVSEHMGTGSKSPGMLVPVHLSVAEVKGQKQQVAATSECFVGG